MSTMPDDERPDEFETPDCRPRGEDLARRRSPQPSMLVEYYRQRDEQVRRVQQRLDETRRKERE